MVWKCVAMGRGFCSPSPGPTDGPSCCFTLDQKALDGPEAEQRGVDVEASQGLMSLVQHKILSCTDVGDWKTHTHILVLLSL